MDETPQRPPQPPPSRWGSGLRRHRSAPPRGFVIASFALHFVIVAAFVIAGMGVRTEPQLEQFRVTLVSPPPQVRGPPEPVVTTTPVAVAPEPPKPEPPKPKPKQPAVKEPPRTQAPRPKPVEAKPESTPARGENPKPGPVGGENIQLEQDGREFQYPEYLENIALQINRFFRWNGPTDLEAEVLFYILRDGSVGGIRVVRKSGNFRFDLQTADALDEIGRARAFGPLPDGWQRDRLYISYTFQKPR
jgi:outer membrane biosynthesis protein TonB